MFTLSSVLAGGAALLPLNRVRTQINQNTFRTASLPCHLYLTKTVLTTSGTSKPLQRGLQDYWIF